MYRVVVYGLGVKYQEYKHYIESEFDVVAYSDKEIEKYEDEITGKLIAPKDITSVEFDFIYITSQIYMDEIRNELINNYGIKRKMILTNEDVWWRIKNQEIRDEWVIHQLKRIEPGKTILDAGAGRRKYSTFCKHLNYISQDFGKYDDEKKTVGLHGGGADKWDSMNCDLICDISNIPLNDGSLDAILCTEVFEHIKNPIDVLKEFFRLLKKGGLLILTAPFCAPTHQAPFYYYNGFSRYWYNDILNDTGFEIKEMESYGNWFVYMAQEIERMTYMTKRYGCKMSQDEIQAMIKCTQSLIYQGTVDNGSDEVLCIGYFVQARKRVSDE